MVTLLRRLFIKDYQDIKNPIIRKKHIELASFFGLFINIVLIILKFTAAILMWQITKIFSGALLADALNNTTDVVTSLINIISNKLSEKPADKEHPFGHGRYEDMSGFIEGGLIIFAALYIIYEAGKKLIFGYTMETESFLGIAVMGFAVVSNFLVSTYLFHVAKRDILLGAFNHADICAVDASELCEFFLREILRLAILLNVVPEQKQNRFLTH